MGKNNIEGSNMGNINNRINEIIEKKNNKANASDKNNAKRYIIISIISIILLISAIAMMIYNLTKTHEVNEEKVSYITGNKQEKEVVKKVRNEDAYKRMKVYLGKVITKIAEEDYNYAYNRLYSGFRESNFPTEKSFENYCKSYFPKNMTYRYKNFDKIGDYYVAVVDLVNTATPNDEKNREDMYFVFNEYDFDDYVFSFSTITLEEDIQIKAIENSKK